MENIHYLLMVYMMTIVTDYLINGLFKARSNFEQDPSFKAVILEADRIRLFKEFVGTLEESSSHRHSSSQQKKSRKSKKSRGRSRSRSRVSCTSFLWVLG